jgi:capsular exopolysaccharide synthesis family protein
VQVIWRHRLLIFAVVIVAIGGSVAYDVLTSPVYQATAQVELTPQLSAAVLQVNGASSTSSATAVDVPTDIQVMESTTVRDAVLKRLPNAPGVSVAQIGTTNVVNVSVRSTDPGLAAEAANDYANDYISAQLKQAVNSLDNAEQIVQAHITSIEKQIGDIQGLIAVATSGDLVPLQTELTGEQTEQLAYQSELAQYQFAATLDTGGGQVIGPATVPTKPADPKKVLNGVLALVVGLIVGIAAAFLIEYYDDAIRTKDDLERETNGLPTLGLIPPIANWKKTGDAYLVSLAAPASPPSEAYRSLRTSIQFLGLDRSIRTLQFTSPNAADGKTTTLANMATSMVQADQRVVVVCCDLRRPRIHQFFGLSNSVGFTSVLLGTATLEEALQTVPDIPGLYVLASGPIPPNPSELLSGHRAKAIFNQLADIADIVLIDSPPVLPVTDAAVLATQVDGVLLVTSVGQTSRRDVTRCLEVMGRVDAPLVGVVLNRASETDQYAYYRYWYGASSPKNEPTLSSQIPSQGGSQSNGSVHASTERGPRSE